MVERVGGKFRVNSRCVFVADPNELHIFQLGVSPCLCVKAPFLLSTVSILCLIVVTSPLWLVFSSPTVLTGALSRPFFFSKPPTFALSRPFFLSPSFLSLMFCDAIKPRSC
jgi:hypothetical protein